MKAKLIYQNKVVSASGITELVIWELPHPTLDRPHGIKYRCYHGNRVGQCIVRYDNESGKGDHKHIGNKEVPYEFVNVEKLIRDFFNDIQQFASQEK